MNREQISARISGCYIPMPTLFVDGSLEVNLPGMRRHTRFLLDAGVREGNGVLLVCGGAGEFHVLNTEERLQIAEAVIDEAGGKVGVILGVQSTDPREVATLARGAKRLGAVAIQASPPFYEIPTEDDVYEFMTTLASAADIAIVYYTTYWTGFRISMDLIDRMIDIPQMVGLKWASPSVHEFDRGLRRFSSRLCVIDNQLDFVKSHMLGARGVNVHPANYFPAWGVQFWNLLETGRYREAQESMTRVIAPCYDLYGEIGKFTGGEGHLDKLCLELVGLDSSRCRPPIRDIRDRFREQARTMLLECGVPNVR